MKPSLLTFHAESHLLSLLSFCFRVLILSLELFKVLLPHWGGNKPQWGLCVARRNFVFEITKAPGCWEGFPKSLQLAPLAAGCTAVLVENFFDISWRRLNSCIKFECCIMYWVVLFLNLFLCSMGFENDKTTTTTTTTP